MPESKVAGQLKYKDLQANVPNIDNYLSKKVNVQISPVKSSVDGQFKTILNIFKNYVILF